MQDPTIQTATPEKLERRYLLRERKQSQRFYWSYLNYENCSRHLHAFLLVHNVIVVLGFFFFLPLFPEGASVISRTLRTRSSFDVYDILGRTCLWCLLRFTVQIGLRKYLKPQYILECFHGFIIKIYHHGPNLTFLTITVLRNWTPYQHAGAISWT